MKLKKILIFLLIAVFCVSASSLFAQKKSKTKSSAKSLKAKKKKQPKTISGGVVNGKAIELATPVYPQAAKMIGLYGKVEVQVLIDVDGKVLTAKVISGNPILRSASVNAALKSKFAPIQIGGEFVRISGYINYIFLPTTLNWLEIGYILQKLWSGYYSSLKIEDYFPIGFEEEIQLLNQKSVNQDEIREIVIASLQNKLSNNPKSVWLFSLGAILGKTRKICCLNEPEMQNFAHQIKMLIQLKPENISHVLISKLEKFIDFVENPSQNNYKQNSGNQIYKMLTELEQNFPVFGK